MCTLTYLPLASGPEGLSFLLTSNRDERRTRPDALFPVSSHTGDSRLLFPQDAQAGGTWIATGQTASGLNLTACLLNGGQKAHQPAPPYRMSRGLIIPEMYAAPDWLDYLAGNDFAGIEPFTLVVVEQAPATLTELRWDGTQRHLRTLSAGQPYIWSSVTLYSPEAIRQREAWFREWLADTPVYTIESIRSFHHFGGQSDPYNSLMMQRMGEMSTVSITTVECRGERVVMWYEDRKKESLLQQEL